MSCLSRQVVENRIKRQRAKEEGNTNALLGLVVFGCLLFAGHAIISQAGRIGHSLKDLFRTLSKKDIVSNSGKQLAKQFTKEEWRNMAEYTTNAMDDRER